MAGAESSSPERSPERTVLKPKHKNHRSHRLRRTITRGGWVGGREKKREQSAFPNFVFLPRISRLCKKKKKVFRACCRQTGRYKLSFGLSKVRESGSLAEAEKQRLEKSPKEQPGEQTFQGKSERKQLGFFFKKDLFEGLLTGFRAKGGKVNKDNAF